MLCRARRLPCATDERCCEGHEPGQCHTLACGPMTGLHD